MDFLIKESEVRDTFCLGLMGTEPGLGRGKGGAKGAKFREANLAFA